MPEVKSLNTTELIMPNQHNLLAADDVLPRLMAWSHKGLRAALVTLVTIDGTAPRPLGSQMAVAENGEYVGYLSGGCLEQAVAVEAQIAILERRNRLVRYGKGSPYFDIKLPCESGLELYIDQTLGGAFLDRMAQLRANRRAFWLETDLESGHSRVTTSDERALRSERAGATFRRAYIPPVKALLIGGGPSLVAIAQVVAAAGLELDIVTPDDASRQELFVLGFTSRGLTDATQVVIEPLDHWTAVILAFHEHDWEAPLLARILRTDCYYIGALGSKQAQANRLKHLITMGFAADELARVRGPIGLIPGAKSRVTLAVGILAEIVAEAKARGMMS